MSLWKVHPRWRDIKWVPGMLDRYTHTTHSHYSLGCSVLGPFSRRSWKIARNVSSLNTFPTLELSFGFTFYIKPGPAVQITNKIYVLHQNWDFTVSVLAIIVTYRETDNTIPEVSNFSCAGEGLNTWSAPCGRRLYAGYMDLILSKSFRWEWMYFTRLQYPCDVSFPFFYIRPLQGHFLRQSSLLLFFFFCCCCCCCFCFWEEFSYWPVLGPTIFLVDTPTDTFAMPHRADPGTPSLTHIGLFGHTIVHKRTYTVLTRESFFIGIIYSVWS